MVLLHTWLQYWGGRFCRETVYNQTPNRYSWDKGLSPYELSVASAACCVFELESGLNSSEAVQQEGYFGCVYQSVIIQGSTSIALKEKQ